MNMIYNTSYYVLFESFIYNSIFFELDEIEYEANRVPLEGVPLNVSQENMHGCDCTDGCRDRTKCACWRKTFEVVLKLFSGIFK